MKYNYKDAFKTSYRTDGQAWVIKHIQKEHPLDHLSRRVFSENYSVARYMW